MEKQKLKEKSNVGALSVRNTRKKLPNCAQKENKGITLVALIITIIVLLILAVVAIRAVQGDGIIGHAKNAKSATIIEQEKEQIQLAVNEWQIQKNYQNEPGSFKTFMISKLIDTGIATSIDGDDNGPLTVTMKSGNVYIVTESGGITPVTKGVSLSSTTLSIEPGATAQLTAILTGGVTGNITWTSENTDVVTITTSEDKLTATLTVAEGATIGTTVEITATCGEYSAKCTVTVEETSGTDKLAKYILGENGEGREVLGILNPSSMVFLQDPDDSTSTMHQKVKLTSAPEGTDLYIRYNRNIYKFSINGEFKTVKGSLTLVNTPAGNLGKYVTYQGKTWIVFREDTNGVELISANAINIDEEGNGLTLGGTDFDSARTSYNNAISTLTKACKDATGITGNIRNVGGPAEDETTSKVVFSTLTKFTPNEGVTFGDYEGETNGLKVGDEKYISDYEQMENLGILATDTPADYWLASRFVREGSSNVSFRMRYVHLSGELNDYGLGDVSNSGSSCYYSTNPCAVRPVVSLSSGILDSATQSGTIDDPIILQ